MACTQLIHLDNRRILRTWRDHVFQCLYRYEIQRVVQQFPVSIRSLVCCPHSVGSAVQTSSLWTLPLPLCTLKKRRLHFPALSGHFAEWGLSIPHRAFSVHKPFLPAQHWDTRYSSRSSRHDSETAAWSCCILEHRNYISKMRSDTQPFVHWWLLQKNGRWYILWKLLSVYGHGFYSFIKNKAPVTSIVKTVVVCHKSHLLYTLERIHMQQ